MATIYLSSVDGSDADNGSTWALAKATLAAALTAAGAGGTVYVDNAHAETLASAMTLTSPGTAASPTTVLCCSRSSGAPPTALATTATVTTTGSNTISFAGFAYSYGVTYSAATGAGAGGINFTSTSPWWWRIESGALRLANSNAASRIGVGSFFSSSGDDCRLELVNCGVRFGSASQGLRLSCPVRWVGGSVESGGTLPTALFVSPAGTGPYGSAVVRGVDLSQLASGQSLVGVGVDYCDYQFFNCKLGASVALVSGTAAGQGGTRARLVNCDSADTNYRYALHCYQGDITQETVIVRTGGASDGTTPVSRKMVSSANAKFYSPLESDPIVAWNETTGSSVTATVEVVTDGVTLTDAEAWAEVEYLGTSGFPLASTASDRAADILATPANQTTSSVTWTTTGLSSPTKQKLSVTFTPQEKGPVSVRVMIAKASTTVYVCPKVDIT